MSRKKRRTGSGRRGNPQGSTQQKMFWVLSAIVVVSMVAYFGPAAPARRSSTPPTLTPTPLVTITPTIAGIPLPSVTSTP